MNLQLETTPLCPESSSQAAEYLHSFLTLPSLAMDTETVRSLARSCLKKFLLSPHQSANKKAHFDVLGRCLEFLLDAPVALLWHPQTDIYYDYADILMFMS